MESAKYYQFVRSVEVGGRARALKIDLLARIPSSEEEKRGARADARRVRGRGFGLLHAHATPEAATIEEALTPLRIVAGDEDAAVYLPHPFSYLLLKLSALRDQLDAAGKDYGRHHAADVFSTVAMMTADDWRGAVELRRTWAGEPAVEEADHLATTLFGDRSSPGVQRLVDHFAALGRRIPLDEVDAFCLDLAAIFGHP